jgi:CIC family chloride channel protein
LGVAFNRALVGTLDAYARWGQRWARLGGRTATWAGGLVGAASGLLGWFLPSAVGSGHRLAEAVLDRHIALAAVPWWFALRFGLTTIGYGSGVPGGIFTPLLVLGALLGLAVGDVGHLLLPQTIDHPEAFAVVGMAAYFSAIVLIVEMTNSYQQMRALLVACFAAHLVADARGARPIYEALLDRDLRRRGGTPESRGTLVLELIVQPDAPFAGQLVKDFGLPPGCLLVMRRRGLRDEVLTANTRLAGGDRLIAVIAPQASAAVRLLWQGREPRQPARGAADQASVDPTRTDERSDGRAPRR